VVVLKEALWGSMFENLNDDNAFRKFEVSDVVHTIRRENDSNLTPEYLYEKKVEQGAVLGCG
jgi:ABC-type uncharacterized transport system auxiliary subunit